MKRLISIFLINATLLLPFVCNGAGEGTYMESLAPVVYLEMDATPAASVTLGNGSVLNKSASFSEEFPTAVSGPNSWTSNAWDFSVCDGAYMMTVDSAMSAVGNFTTTDGMTVSFWSKGLYSGRLSRIMAGAFDIGTNEKGFWGGTADYQNAQSATDPLAWDDSWHHFAVTVNFSNILENIKVYLDGEVVGTKDAVYLNSVNSSVGQTWAFGARNSSDEGFDFGALAGIAVFDSMLDAYDINYIFQGPVFAGLDQTIYIFDTAPLSGIVPSGETSVWSRISGPVGGETIMSPSDAETTVQFSQTGEYIFQLSCVSGISTSKVTVLENAAPYVNTGNGIVATLADMPLQLQGVVTDDSIPTGGALTQIWQVVSLPEGSTVVFVDEFNSQTMVTFSMAGLYRLALSAGDGELTSTEPLSVLITDETSMSYVRLLRPVVLLGFENPAKDLIRAEVDQVGATGYNVRYSENGLPQLDVGARSYTGYAWDFDGTDSDIEVINGSHLRNIQNKEHPARSFSYWFKAETSLDEGYISTLLGYQDYRNGLIQTGVYAAEVTRLSKALQPGDWHHVVVVIESDGEWRRKFYVDSVLIADSTEAYVTPWWEMGSDDMGTPFYIGSRGRTGEADSFGGLLDDFAIFDYALSTNDVNYLYQGPTQDQIDLMAVQDTLSVNAGDDIYVPLPGSYVQSLTGSVSVVAGTTPFWRMVDGDGTVSFDDPSSLTPTVTFEANNRNADGEYSPFILELSLRTADGLTMVADTVRVVFYPVRAPAIRSTITATPPTNQHPRIFFTQADLGELRGKATNVPVAMRAILAMQNRVANLEDSEDTYGMFYQELKAGREVSLETVYGDSAGGIFEVFAESAYLAWLGTDGVSDTATLEEVADVFAAACRNVTEWYEPDYKNALLHDINWAVGLCYDLLYNNLTDDERKEVRDLLSLMTSFRHPHGSNLSRKYNYTNWAGYHDHTIMALMAIEGEEGYDVGVLDAIERKNAAFLTQNGVFESGYPHEGYAYYCFGMTWHSISDYVLARRADRENIFNTTRFYRSIEAAFRLFDPNGSAIRSHHDTVEGSTGSGEIAIPQRHIMVAKYMWPDDRMVDYVYGKLVANNREERYLKIFDAVFAEDVKYPEQTVAEAAGTLSPNKFCPDRGLVTSRNEWEDDGLRFEFRCRQDKYYLGHQHSDVNSFELFSHGKEWIIDPGKFASTVSDVSSTILVDGTGACSSSNYRWPSLPGQFVEYAETTDGTLAAGDARLYYSYSKGAPRAGETATPADYKVTDHGLLWSDFYTLRTGYDIPEWMTYTPYDLNNYGNLDGIYTMVPVDHAFRTTFLTKGSNPFVLIVDDIQQDEGLHDYTWLAGMVTDGSVEVESQTNDKLVLRYAGEEESGARLLVQVLNANGQSGSIQLDTDPVIVELASHVSTRIKIESSQVVSPDFKVLLYPYMTGDPLPDVQWNANGNIVRITIDADTRQFYFGEDDDKRTRVLLEAPAVEVSESSVALEVVNGYIPDVPMSHQFDISSNLDIAQIWTATVDQAWVSLSASSGVIAASNTLHLTTILEDEVSQLPVGIHTATITFSSAQDIFDRLLTVVVTVVDPYGLTPPQVTFSAMIDQVESLSKDFVITNRVPVSQSWTASVDQTWISLSATSGTLPGHGSITLNAALESSAFTLPEGSYEAIVTFAGEIASSNLEAVIFLNVSEVPAYIPTEEFTSSSAFDLDYKQLTFVPAGDSYKVYLKSVTNLPVSLEGISSLGDISGGYSEDDGYWTFTPAWQSSPTIGGSAVSSIHIGSNGYITFEEGYYSWTEDATDHFSRRQISALWEDLSPQNGDGIYYEFIPGDRVVITYFHVPEYGTSTDNTVQVEIFDDGSNIIRLTYLQIDTADALVGISQGTGTSTNWPANGVDFSSLSPMLTLYEQWLLDNPDAGTGREYALIEYALGGSGNETGILYHLSIDDVSGDPIVTLDNQIPSDVSLWLQWSTNLPSGIWSTNDVIYTDPVFRINGVTSELFYVKLAAELMD
jgi:hypothetical protein